MEYNKKEFDIISFYKKKKSEASYLRYNFEKNWYRNILFYIGKQWIKYDSSKRIWTKVDLPSWFPTPITNKYAAAVDSICSVVKDVNPEVVASPATDNIEDINSAEIARTIIDICEEESGYREKKDKEISWLINTGNVFLYTYYDNSMAHGKVEIELYMCPKCGYTDTIDKFDNEMCPNCGSVGVISSGQKREYPRGKIVTEVLSPFEVYCDLQIKDIKEQPYIIIMKTIPEEEAKKRWGDDLPKTEDNTQLGLQFFNSLAYITNTSDAQFQGVGQFYASSAKLVTVAEMFIKPMEGLENGWHGFICNDKILEGGDLEFINPSGQRYIPIIKTGCNDVPKRFFDKTFADDLVHKQIQRNKLESFIQLCVHRVSNPVWLIPNTSGVEDITGEPGEKIRFNDSNTAHGVPTRLPGVEITQSIFRWLDKIDADFEELSATYDILKGNVPPNVPTLGGLELLKERGFSRFNRLIANIEKSRVELAYHWIWMWKQFATEARTISFKDTNGRWKFKSFTNSDLSGNISIRIEPGTSNPRSEGYKQYIAGQLLGYGMLDVNDPIVKYKVLKVFHADNFADNLKYDMEYVGREEGAVSDGIVPTIRPEIDNHELHIASHLNFAKSDKFNILPPEIQTAFENHILDHKRLMMTQQQNVAMANNEENSVAVPQSGGDLMNLIASKGGNQPAGVETSQIEQEGGLNA